MKAGYIVIDSYTMNWFGFGAISPLVSAAWAARSSTCAAETARTGGAAGDEGSRRGGAGAGAWPPRALTTPTATTAATPAARAARHPIRHARGRGGGVVTVISARTRASVTRSASTDGSGTSARNSRRAVISFTEAP